MILGPTDVNTALREEACLHASSSSSLLLSRLELSDTKVYEPQIRALLGTAAHFCEVYEPASEPLHISAGRGLPACGRKGPRP